MAKIFTQLGCCLFVITQIIASPIQGRGKFGDKFQGDIKLSAEQMTMLGQQDDSQISSHTGWTHSSFHWPTNIEGFVTVPYRINPSEGFTQSEINWMLSEFQLIESTTCIRFIERTFHIDFVDIINGNGCWAWAGRQGGRQEMSMGRSQCFWEGTAVHEAIHVLGYFHMHSAIDRDDFVEIRWDNIPPERQHNFDKVNPTWFSNFGTPYDLLSVMHYPRWAFSKNGEDTIVPHDRSLIDVIGQVRMSPGDVTRLNRMYQCRNYGNL